MITIDVTSRKERLLQNQNPSFKNIYRYTNIKLSCYYTGKKARELSIIKSSEDAEKHFRLAFDPDELSLRESIYLMGLNTASKIIFISQLATGSVNMAVCDVKLLFIHLITLNCQKMILCHNHPSGSLTPSTMDLNLTKKLKSACVLFDIQLCDHLILGPDEGEYYSFVDNGSL